MIIDVILDRMEYEKENSDVTYSDFLEWENSPGGKIAIEKAKQFGAIIQEPYSPKKFYDKVLAYGGKFAEQITYAMDYFGESLVKKTLCEYIIGNDYNPKICDYINSVDWLVPA